MNCNRVVPLPKLGGSSASCNRNLLSYWLQATLKNSVTSPGSYQLKAFFSNEARSELVAVNTHMLVARTQAQESKSGQGTTFVQVCFFTLSVKHYTALY